MDCPTDCPAEMYALMQQCWTYRYGSHQLSSSLGGGSVTPSRWRQHKANGASCLGLIPQSTIDDALLYYHAPPFACSNPGKCHSLCAFAPLHPRKVSAALPWLGCCSSPGSSALGVFLLHQSTFVPSVDSIPSFLPLQMGRAPRIYFRGKHNTLLLLQYCYQDRKWVRDRRQVKSNYSLSFPLCS